jgi:hypothetical protein
VRTFQLHSAETGRLDMLQAAYQVLWMLLILFAAPKLLDRYHIRNSCEIFKGGHDEVSFCDSKDLHDLKNVGDAPRACNAAFPFKAGSTCPIFKAPTESSVAPVCQNDVACFKEAKEARSIWLIPATVPASPSRSTYVAVQSLLPESENDRGKRKGARTNAG